jgi:FkbM family methyltransferase
VTGNHPIFDLFRREPARVENGYRFNIMGASVHCEWETELGDGLLSSGASARQGDNPTLPDRLSEDYYEWAALLLSIAEAGERFVMMELGAGYGRWSINAYLACGRVLDRKPPRPIIYAVEADARRIPLLREHCARHVKDGDAIYVEQAAVAAKTMPALYDLAHDAKNYGNGIIWTQEEADGYGDGAAPMITWALADVLQLPGRPIDFLDMDIQGAELEALPAAIDTMNRVVKRLHLGTHRAEIDAMATNLLIANGWRIVVALPHCSWAADAPYGAFKTDDGVITAWNTRFS